MTFLTDLARLREAATNEHPMITHAKYDLKMFLVNHAEVIEELVRAILPLAHYSKMRDEKPMNGMDDAIHSIHVGTEWEAELTQSQLRSLRQALEKMNRSE